MKMGSYTIDILSADIHHVLYYANLFIGESATMATESAVLGIPARYPSPRRDAATLTN